MILDPRTARVNPLTRTRRTPDGKVTSHVTFPSGPKADTPCHLQLIDGSTFDLLAPAKEDICPNIIGRVLARTPRFGGHTRKDLPVYSVAQHSLHVARLVPRHLTLIALLHDAHEAYSGFGDIQTPAYGVHPILKAVIKQHTARIDKVIAEAFSFDPTLFHDPAVKHADNVAFATERRDLLENNGAGVVIPEGVELPEPDAKRIEVMSEVEARNAFAAKIVELIYHR